MLSHPTRVRGLKPAMATRPAVHAGVAPHAGAWIETHFSAAPNDSRLVAPHAGAWIETSWSDSSDRSYQVAPHAGAWIETDLKDK